MILYRINRDNQELYINQEWKVIYYTVLLYAGIFAAFVNVYKSMWLMYVVAILAFFASTIIMIICESSLDKTRNIDKGIREEKSFYIMNKILGTPDHKKSKCIFWLLIFANFISYIVLLVSIYYYKR